MKLDRQDEPDLRLDFPVTKKMIYMNNGAVAPTSLAVIKAMTDFLVKCANEGPDSQATSDYISSVLREVRMRAAHLINCDPEEIVLTQSTTEGINMVVNGIAWEKGDSIVTRGGDHEHPANYLPWLRLASRNKGVKLEQISIDENGFFDEQELEKRLRSRNCRLVTMSHALYNTGAILALERVGKMAEEKGILLCVDAAQTAGTIEIDVKRMGCHFMAFPGFKWLCGPMGIGILYCSKKAVERIEPPAIGGESANISKGIIALREMPHRLQAGFRNYPGAAGLEAALRYILRIGINNVRLMNMKVAEALRQELSQVQGVTVYGPKDSAKRTSIVTFSMNDKDPSFIVKKLEEESSIILAAREDGRGKKVVRATPHFFNTEDEAAAVVAQIKRV